MASVEQIKDALLADQARAIEAYEAATAAISTITSVASWAVAIMGFVVAIFAIFGWQVIKQGAHEGAIKVANKRLDDYLSSEQFGNMLDDRLSREIAERARSEIAVKDPIQDEPDPFPELKDRDL